jgi:hypothetical protein
MLDVLLLCLVVLNLSSFWCQGIQAASRSPVVVGLCFSAALDVTQIALTCVYCI